MEGWNGRPQVLHRRLLPAGSCQPAIVRGQSEGCVRAGEMGQGMQGEAVAVDSGMHGGIPDDCDTRNKTGVQSWSSTMVCCCTLQYPAARPPCILNPGVSGYSTRCRRRNNGNGWWLGRHHSFASSIRQNQGQETKTACGRPSEPRIAAYGQTVS